MKSLLLKKIAMTGVLSGFALIAFILESLMPPLILPSARLGFANIFILLAVILLGDGYGVCVFAVKVVLGSILTGNISATLYSLPAGAIALCLEILLLHFYKKFGVISISVFGGCVNLVLQNVAFALITGVPEQLSYLPYFALIGILSGSVIGIIVWLIDKKLPASIKTRFTKQKSFDSEEKDLEH